MAITLKDRILFKRAETEAAIVDNTTLVEETIYGEILLCYEKGKERLYTKNQSGNLVPIHRIMDGGQFTV